MSHRFLAASNFRTGGSSRQQTTKTYSKSNRNKNNNSNDRDDEKSIHTSDTDFMWAVKLFGNQDYNRNNRLDYKQLDKQMVEKEQQQRLEANTLDNNKIIHDKKQSKSQINEQKNDINEITRNQFVALIIDCLSLNHSKYCNKIDDNFMASLGDSNNISENGIKHLANRFSKQSPIKLVMTDNMDNNNENDNSDNTDNSDDDEDDDEDDDNEEDDDTKTNENELNFNNIPSSIDTISILKSVLRLKNKDNNGQLPNGFALNDEYLRAMCDASKCRVNIEDFVQFDVGINGECGLSASDLIALLLEISHPSVHKIVEYNYINLPLFFFNCFFMIILLLLLSNECEYNIGVPLFPTICLTLTRWQNFRLNFTVCLSVLNF